MPTTAENYDRLAAALGPPSPGSTDAAFEMPVSRAHSPAGILGIARERRDLWTREVKHRIGVSTSRSQPQCTESWLHTDDCVFLYLAGFGFPNTEAGFLFRRSLESDPDFPGWITPFDSGSLWCWHNWPGAPAPDAADDAGRHARAAAARDFLIRHSLSPADARDYLARVIAHRFSRPSGYFWGDEPAVPDLHGLTPVSGKSSDRRRWTFELRIPVEAAGGLPIPSAHLEAVFLRAQLQADPGVRRFIMDCRNSGVEVVLFDDSTAPTAFEALQRKGIEYLESHLTVSLNP